MIYLLFLIWVWINSSYAQQYYDSSDCSSDTNYPGSRYTCNSFQSSCQTFLVYRANQHFQTISNISNLFHMNSHELLQWNNLKSSSEILKPGREILLSINCSCTSGQFFQANFSYIVPESTMISEVACGVFEGLLKSLTLFEENPTQGNELKVGSNLHLPLKCACPDNFSSSNGVKYLVTYPFVEGDETYKLSQKFGVSLEDLWAANNLEPNPTVYPNTTVLVPLKTDPFINFSIPLDSPPPAPDFLPTTTIEKTRNTKARNLYIAGSVVGFSLILVAFISCKLYVKAIRERKGEKLQSFTARSSFSTTKSSTRSAQTGRSSNNSCLSPDLLVGIKYSLNNYGIGDLRKATRDFSEDTKINHQVYKGFIDNNVGIVMIKEMKLEDTRRVIDMHSKINHINILNLIGVCYGESDFSLSYLVFEFPINGCLRDCLSNSSSTLRWHRRTQIAFDIATGLHYLHYCIFPTYAHMSINSRNIFVTSNWRAKLANIGSSTPAVGSSIGNDNIFPPEYLINDSPSEKVDIFAFGVVLLELISGREEYMDGGKLLKDSIGFLGGGASDGGCFEQLRSFMDSSLKEDYPLAEALCLAVLAKACIEDDPLHRPSMDDIMKVLARMV